MQRYHEYRDGFEPDDDGEWVYWDEAMKALAAKDARIASLEADISTLRTIESEMRWRLGIMADERARERKATDEARRVVAFFASVIKGGEKWSDECDAALRRAMGESE